MHDRGAVLAWMKRQTWAIDEDALTGYVEALSGPAASGPGHEALTAAALRATHSPSGTIGHLGIGGPITHRSMPLFSLLFGGTSIVELRAGLSDLLLDTRVDAIVLEVDSPGGTSDGLIEFATELRQARTQKPVFALVNTLAASAAYWLASQATEILLTPSSEVGSVGVYWLHIDVSQLNERIGVKPTYVFAGRHKVEGNANQPLSEDARRHWQEQVDRTHDLFVADIVRGRGRGLTADTVRRTFGAGRVITDPADAVARKMADRVFPTPAQALGYIGAGSAEHRAARTRAAAQADIDFLNATLAATRRPPPHRGTWG